MTIKYKRTIGLTNVCSRMQEHIIKFKLLNQVLVLKEQDSKHTLEHLNFERSWRTVPDSEEYQTLKDSDSADSDSEGHVSIRILWQVFSSFEGRSLSDSNSMVCLRLTTWINKQRTSMTVVMK